MAKAKTCPSKYVPDQVIKNQLDQLDQAQQKCMAAGGTVSVVVYYGCSKDPMTNKPTTIDQAKGKSGFVPYEDPYGSPLDYLPDPVTGQIPSEDAVKEIVRKRKEEAIRQALEDAANAAKNKAGCGSGSGDPAFVVAGFCTKAGEVIDKGTYPPFISQK